MSKPFAVKVLVSDRVQLTTTDGSASVVVDQGDPSNRVSITTDLFSRGILLQNDPACAFQLIGGNIFLFSPNGNVVTTAQQALSSSNNDVQSILTLDHAVTLDPADPVYDELSNVAAGGLSASSRLSIAPDALLGTTVLSIIVNAGNPNPEGRELQIHNIGTAPTQILTLVNLSPAPGANPGGLFRGPGDYVIPAGGGVTIVFDTAHNAWSVLGI